MNDKTDRVVFNALNVGGIIEDDILMSAMYKKHPIDHDKADKVKNSVVEALKEILFTPGAVVSITCGTFPEAELASMMIEQIGQKVHEHCQLVPNKSDSTHFEFSNNSAIYINVKKLFMEKSPPR